MHDRLTHAYVHWLADVHSAVFAPAFTLSFHDSECSRKPPMPIASVVICQFKNQRVLSLVVLELEDEVLRAVFKKEKKKEF